MGIIASVVRHVMYGIPDAKERSRVGNPKARAYDVSTQVASIRIAPDVKYGNIRIQHLITSDV